MDLGRLIIDGVEYRAVQDSAGGPAAVRGEHSTVYRLRGPSGDLALKVPDPGGGEPGPAETPAGLAEIPGLAAARVWPVDEVGAGAFVMPWVDGPNWAEVVADRRPLDLEECWALARALVRTLVGLEARGFAHLRLCGRHLLLPGLSGAAWPVELVDLEHLCGPGQTGSAEGQGTPGYGSGEPRLAAAVLLAELLGWWHPAVREGAWGEHYFAPDEVPGCGPARTDGERYRVLTRALRERWGPWTAGLFERAWGAGSDGERPAFREWARVLPPEIGALKDSGTADPLMGLLALAGRLEERGIAGGALVRYRQLAGLLPAGGPLEQGVTERIRRLEGAVAAVSRPAPADPVGTERRHCRHCGSQLKPMARFCSRCGAPAGHG